MSASYEEPLDYALEASFRVTFKTERGLMVDYSVVLVVGFEDEAVAVRVYDGAHGRNEVHRFTRTGEKLPGEIFHRGTLSEGMQLAIAEIQDRYARMIEGWEAR